MTGESSTTDPNTTGGTSANPTPAPASANPASAGGTIGVIVAAPPSPSTPTELTERLTALDLTGVQIDKLKEEGVRSADDMARLNADQIKQVTGCGLVTAMKVAEAFKPALVAIDQVVSMEGLLPSVPDDDGFLGMLKTGGVLKSDPLDVISAIRAGIGARLNIFDVPETVLDRIERFAEEQDEPASPDLFKLISTISAQRRYGDVLTAMGVPGNFISDRRKKDVLGRLDTILWPALRDFHEQLRNWSDSWNTGAGSTGMALTVIAMNQAGMKGVFPPGMLTPPQTNALRDAAEGVIDRINKVFAGVGVPVARALAYDATRIKGILLNPALPAAIGVATRDQMLKALNINVGSDMVRLETDVVQYALAVMRLSKVSSGLEQYGYLGAMLQLGNQIPWEKLTSGTLSTTTTVRRTTVTEDSPIAPRRTPYGGNGRETQALAADGFRLTADQRRNV